MVDQAITRIEYEARTKQLTMDIRDVSNKVDKLEEKIDDVRSEVMKLRSDTWKFVATCMLNFFLGGGAVALIEYLAKR